MKRALLALAVLAVITLFTWLILQDRSQKSFVYYDFGAAVPGSYNYFGIDISHHQGEINWAELGAMSVDQDSIEFVYIKCTEGLTHEDKRWKENAAGAFSEKIPFGLYHFMQPGISARKQALLFADKCLAANDTLRPMLDIETSNGFSSKRLVDSVYTFIQFFEQKMKMKPIIYTYESFYNDHFSHSYLQNEYFWMANYNGECSAVEKENVIVWQFSERGTVNGISEKVDLNVAKESFKEVMFQD